MLLAFVTQLATTLLSSFSNCNYIFDFCKKTIEALNRIFWREKCYFSESTKTLRWKWAVTVVKRENIQISESIFGMFLMKEIRVSPQCHNYSFFKKVVLLRARFPVRRDVCVYGYYIIYWINTNCMGALGPHWARDFDPMSWGWRRRKNMPWMTFPAPVAAVTAIVNIWNIQQIMLFSNRIYQ